MREYLETAAADAVVIAERRDVDSPMVDRALELVKNFIKVRQRILYGGQAIDFALRLRGTSIYPDHQRPDYDFYSPDSVGDAYDIAEMLSSKGFPNVVARGAVHAQTMRVAVDFVFIADVSFVPQSVYETLPTVTYSGMKVLHPDYQRIDMHLAFSFPLANPPREDLYHRFAKDIKRFNMFEEFFPLSTGDALGTSVVANEVMGGDEKCVRGVPLDKVALHGIAAYAALCQSFDLLVAHKIGESVINAPVLKVKIKIERSENLGDIWIDDSELHESIRGEPLAFASPWSSEVVKILQPSGATRYAPYIGSCPEVTSGENFEVFSTKNKLLAVWGFGGESVGVLVSCNQYMLMYFLYKAHVSSGERRNAFLQLYKDTITILSLAEDILVELVGKSPAGKSPEDIKKRQELFDKLVVDSPFGLSVKTIGDSNMSPAYLINTAKSAKMTKVQPPFELPAMDTPPKLYAPGDTNGRSSRRPEPFVYEDHPSFMRDGRKLE